MAAIYKKADGRYWVLISYTVLRGKITSVKYGQLAHKEDWQTFATFQDADTIAAKLKKAGHGNHSVSKVENVANMLAAA